MYDVKMTIENMGKIGEQPTATEAAQKAIYVESEHGKTVYCITLCGAYERKFYFVTELSAPDTERLLLDGNMLIVCLWSDIVIIDLTTGKIHKVISVTPYLDMFGIYKFKDGYFVHGETTNRYFDSKFKLVWEEGGRDIFYCPERKTGVEIYDDHIDVWDFLGYKYSYDELGQMDKYWRTVLKKNCLE